MYEKDFRPDAVFINRVESERSDEFCTINSSVKYSGAAPTKNLCTINKTLNNVLCLMESQCKFCKTSSVT